MKAIKIILLFVAFVSMYGCKTKSVVQTVTNEIIVHDTVRYTDIQLVKDSVIMHDSVIVERDTAGRVVYKEVYRDRWRNAETVIEKDTVIMFISEENSSSVKVETIEKKGGIWNVVSSLLSIAMIVCIILFCIRRVLDKII